MSLRSIVRSLVKQAEDNEERAYRILGARPGPGVDLLIYPVEPLCGKWHVDGLTVAGKSWITKFWTEQPMNNFKLAQLRREAIDWKLTFQTRYPTLSLEAGE